MYKITSLLNAKPVKSKCTFQHPLPDKAPQKTNKCSCACNSENTNAVDPMADPIAAKIQITYDNPAINQEIDKPSHYKSANGRDLIDVCQEFGIDNLYVFNALKYLFRQGKKANNSSLQDLLKARVYIDRYIDFLSKKFLSKNFETTN